MTSLVDSLKRRARVKTRTVISSHNPSRLDGILLVEHLAIKNPELKLHAFIRDGVLYELQVDSCDSTRNKMISRDSLLLLPSKIQELAKSLYPELGGKGDIDHSSVSVNNLVERKGELLSYMKKISACSVLSCKKHKRYTGILIAKTLSVR